MSDDDVVDGLVDELRKMQTLLAWAHEDDDAYLVCRAIEALIKAKDDLVDAEIRVDRLRTALWVEMGERYRQIRSAYGVGG